METSSPDQVDDIFLSALALRDPKERSEYLDRALAGQPEWRRRVERLLAVQAELGSFLEVPAPELSPTLGVPTIEQPGTQVGPYQLLEQIGEGGMGVVYMAEQQTPIRRRVALKIIKPGMDTRRVIARFEAERQALALMDHPNIARVFDAGATSTGRPYFVMELVRGVPVTEYCDQHQVPVPERLKLFSRVCQAVQHAHQKGIIHRDIKPSNVLVTLHDGQPVPKVIDFGIAKATGQQLTHKTLVTDFHQLIGTPLYMSPEQAELCGQDVDTRSDIYSLGVLLYELLTGTTPLESDRLKQATYDEVRRIIREEEPPKPSTRASSLKFSQPGVAAFRQTEPRTLCHLLQGDLDWIVMKALEKDRTRRYATALALAEDTQRHLSDEPVEACPPTALYRLHKLARRRKWTIAITALLLAATLTAMITLVVSNRIIRRERDMAQRQRQIAREAVDKMITNVAEKWLARQAHATPLQREFLADALAFYQERVQDQNVTSEERLEAGHAYRRMGQIHHKLGHSAKAESAFKQAMALLEPLDAKEPLSNDYRVARATCLSEYAVMLNFSFREAEAGEIYARAAEAWQSLADDFPEAADYRVELGRNLGGLADITRDNTGDAEAEPIYRRALKVFETLPVNIDALPETRFILAGTKHEFASCLDELLGGHTEARRLYSEARTLYEQLLAESPREALYRNELAYALQFEAGRIAATSPHEAERLARKALALEEELVAESPDVPDYQFVVSLCHGSIASACEVAGRPQDAVAEMRRAVEVCQKLATRFPDLGAVYYRWLVENRCHLAHLLRSTGQDAEAEQELFRAFSAHEGRPSARLMWPRSFKWQLWHAAFLRSAGRSDEAMAMLRQGIEDFARLSRKLPEETTIVEAQASLHYALGEMLRSAGRPVEAAAEAITASCDLYRKLIAELPDKLDYCEQLTNNYISLRDLWLSESKHAEAAAILRRAIQYFDELAAAHPAEPDYRLRHALFQTYLARLQTIADPNGEVEKTIQQAIESHKAIIQEFPKYKELGVVYLDLAILLTAAHQPGQADSALAKGVELVGSQTAVLNEFAWRCATAAETRFQQPRWAVELAQTAATLVPQTKAYLHTLGAAQYRAGRWQDAVATLDQAVKESSGATSFDFFFLAMAHWQLGNTEVARKWHDQAIAWMELNQPEHHELRRFRAEAEQLLGLAAVGGSASGTAAPAEGIRDHSPLQ